MASLGSIFQTPDLHHARSVYWRSSSLQGRYNWAWAGSLKQFEEPRMLPSARQHQDQFTGLVGNSYKIFWQIIEHEWLKCEHDIWPFLKKRLSSVHWLYNWRFGWPAISYISCFLMIPSYIYERKTHSDFYFDSKDPLMGKFIHRSWPGVDEMQLLDGR